MLLIECKRNPNVKTNIDCQECFRKNRYEASRVICVRNNRSTLKVIETHYREEDKERKKRKRMRDKEKYSPPKDIKIVIKKRYEDEDDHQKDASDIDEKVSIDVPKRKRGRPKKI